MSLFICWTWLNRFSFSNLNIIKLFFHVASHIFHKIRMSSIDTWWRVSQVLGFKLRDATIWKNWSWSSSSWARAMARLATREKSSWPSRSPMWASTRTPVTLRQVVAKARPISAASSRRFTTRGLPPLKSCRVLMMNEPSLSTISLNSSWLAA